MEVLDFERTLTELDHARLVNLVLRGRRSGERPLAPPPAIQQLLDNCAVVASRQMAPDVVTMYSQLMLRDLDTGERYKLTPCYPADAEPSAGFVSVLSPVGSSLLGMRVGSVARWSVPGGGERRAEITAILFQPEGSGDYST